MTISTRAGGGEHHSTSGCKMIFFVFSCGKLSIVHSSQ